jgi:hypothetical protein
LLLDAAQVAARNQYSALMTPELLATVGSVDDVRFAPESGHSMLCGLMSAYDPKRTLMEFHASQFRRQNTLSNRATFWGHPTELWAKFKKATLIAMTIQVYRKWDH